MSLIKYNAPWHSLKHVCVGTTYNLDFYSPIKNSKIRESLQKIAAETEEDYQQLMSVLKSFGVSVSRPEIDNDLTIMNFINDNGIINYSNAHSYTLIPRPPMQPRDSFLVVGEHVLKTNSESSYYQSLIPDNALIANDITNNSFDAPLATVVGDTIILDCREHDWLYLYFLNKFPNYKIKPVYIGGHNDAVYSLIKPGLILSTYHHTNYKDTFPDWSVKFIENQSWDAIPGWKKLKHSNVDKWWVPDNLNNLEFSNFIDTWLGNWVGYVKETVFDVNLLQINANTVLVNNYNKDLFLFFKKHNIEAIVCPFRHRFFWDGGLHCITNDLYREGEREHYV
jgi:hypothetical protein